MSEPIQDVLLDLLRTKGTLGLSRICDHVKRPPQQIEAALSVLRREGKARTLRPGEWEITPVRDSAAEVIPPFESIAIARATPAPKPQHEEGSMASQTKVCNECEKRKPADEFYDGNAKCKPCYNARQKSLKEARAGKSAPPKPQGGVPTAKKKTNGAVKSIREIHAKHAKPNGAGRFAAAVDFLKSERTKVSDELVKIDAAIETLQRLG